MTLPSNRVLALAMGHSLKRLTVRRQPGAVVVVVRRTMMTTTAVAAASAGCAITATTTTTTTTIPGRLHEMIVVSSSKNMMHRSFFCTTQSQWQQQQYQQQPIHIMQRKQKRWYHRRHDDDDDDDNDKHPPPSPQQKTHFHEDYVDDTTLPVRESILSLLQDSKAYPPGSLTPSLLLDTERALDSWTSSSSSKSFESSKNENDVADDGVNPVVVLEYAMFLLMRLVQEEQAHHDRGDDDDGDGQSLVGMRDGTWRPNDDDDVEEKDDRHGSSFIINNNNKSNVVERYTVRPYLLNRVIDFWRIAWTNEILDQPSPTDMVTWIDGLEQSLSSSSSSSSHQPGTLLLSDNRTWTLIVDALCRRGDPLETPLLAQWLLDRRLELAYGFNDSENNDYDYNDDNWHRNHMNDDNDENDHNTMVRMLRPDTFFITNVIRAWAKSRRMEAPEMAEGLLQLMYDLHDSGWADSGPNTMSYGVVMEAWHHSRHPEAKHRIEALLAEMKSSSLPDQVVPDRVCYQYVLNAWANDRTQRGVEKAHAVLREMIALYLEAGNDRVAPNASNFSRVMMAAAWLGDVNRVEQIYDRLQDLHRSTRQQSFRPNLECRKALLIAKAKSGAPAEAQEILDELVNIALSNRRNKTLMPVRSYFVDVLVAWTKHKDRVMAAKRSHGVLDRMLQLAFDERHSRLSPDALSFDKVILTWSRSRHSSAPEQIEQLLAEMERQYNLGNANMKPSLTRYTNYMLAYLRSGRPDAAMQVQRIFEHLQDRCQNGEGDLCPDSYVYGIVVGAWGQSGNVAKAEEVFVVMLNAWKGGNNNVVHVKQPDAHAFHKLLETFSKGNVMDAVEKCEHYMEVMKEVGLPVTVLAYTYLLEALQSTTTATATSHFSSSETTTRRMLQVIEDIVDGVTTGKIRRPVFKEYQEFLRVVARSKIPDRSAQAQERLENLTKGHVPDLLLPQLGNGNRFQ